MAIGLTKDRWDKWQIIAGSLTPVLTAIIVAGVAQFAAVSLKQRDERVAVAMKERDVKVQTLGIAIDILKGEPRKEDKGHMALRRWAIVTVYRQRASRPGG